MDIFIWHLFDKIAIIQRVTGRTTLLTLFFLYPGPINWKESRRTLCSPFYTESLLDCSRETEIFSGSNVKSNNLATKKRCRQVSIPDCNWSLHYRNLRCALFSEPTLRVPISWYRHIACRSIANNFVRNMHDDFLK